MFKCSLFNVTGNVENTVVTSTTQGSIIQTRPCFTQLMNCKHHSRGLKEQSREILVLNLSRFRQLINWMQWMLPCLLTQKHHKCWPMCPEHRHPNDAATGAHLQHTGTIIILYTGSPGSSYLLSTIYYLLSTIQQQPARRHARYNCRLIEGHLNVRPALLIVRLSQHFWREAVIYCNFNGLSLQC